MLKRFLYFVQYNNALPIALSALFLSVSGAFAASPDVRDAVYSAQSAVRSVDNTYLASVDPNNRDFKLRITSIKEDSEKYYVEYAFYTVDIKDYVWQEIPVSKTMTVSKKELLGGDLGIFVARELSQLVDSQKAYLTDAKKVALKDGVTQKVVTVEYSGLVGKFLNPTEEVFAGYTPTKPDTETLATPSAPTTTPPVLPTEVAVSSVAPSVSEPVVAQTPDASAIRSMIEEAVREALAANSGTSSTASVSNSTDSSSTSSSSPAPETTNMSSSNSSNTSTPVAEVASSTESSSASTTESSSSEGSPAPVEATTPVAPPDTTAPTITLNGNNPADIDVGSSYIDLGAVVTDNVDQNLGFTMTPSSVDTSTTSTHTLTFTATDSAGNSASVTRTVNVR